MENVMCALSCGLWCVFYRIRKAKNGIERLSGRYSNQLSNNKFLVQWDSPVQDFQEYKSASNRMHLMAIKDAGNIQHAARILKNASGRLVLVRKKIKETVSHWN